MDAADWSIEMDAIDYLTQKVGRFHGHEMSDVMKKLRDIFQFNISQHHASTSKRPKRKNNDIYNCTGTT
jgi:hypothetical protein